MVPNEGNVWHVYLYVCLIRFLSRDARHVNFDILLILHQHALTASLRLDWRDIKYRKATVRCINESQSSTFNPCILEIIIQSVC